MKFLCLTFILLVSSQVFGQRIREFADREIKTSEICIVHPAPKELQSFLDIYKSNCPSKNPEEYCNCFFSQSKNQYVKDAVEAYKKDNTQIKGRDDWEKMIQTNYTQRLMMLYREMTYGVQNQMSTFKMDLEGDPVVGCTPDDIAGKIAAGDCEVNGGKLCDHGGEKIPEILKTCSNDPLKSGCDDEIKQINEEYEIEKKSRPRFVPSTFTFDTKSVIPTNKDANPASSILDTPETCVFKLEEVLATFSGDKSDDQEISQAKTKEEKSSLKLRKILSKSITFYDKFNKLASNPASIRHFQNVLDKKEKDLGCNDPLLEDYLAEYSFKASRFDMSAIYETQSASNNVAEKLNQNLADLKNVMKKEIEDRNIEGCVSYPTYLALKGSPSPKVLDLLSSSESEAENMLDPEKYLKNEDMKKFLKANPSLAKLTIAPAARKILAQSLSKMAQKSKGKDEASVFKDYFTFMSKDVPKILKSAAAKGADSKQCEQFASNLAAVSSGQHIPPRPLIPEGPMSITIEENTKACLDQIKFGKDDKSLINVLQENQLLSLYLDPYKDNFKQVGPDEDMEYSEFLDKECSGWDKFEKAHRKKICLGKNRCTENIQEAYYKEKQPGLGKLVRATEELTAPFKAKTLDNIILDKNQDVAAKKYYRENIAPKTKIPMFAGKDPGLYREKVAESYKQVDKMQESYNQKPSTSNSKSADVLSTATQNGTNASNTPSQDTKPQAVVNQVQPNWAQQISNAITPQAIRSASGANSFIPENSQLAPSQIQNIQSSFNSQIKKMKDQASDEEKKELELKDKLINAQLTKAMDEANARADKNEKMVNASTPDFTQFRAPASVANVSSASIPGQVYIPPLTFPTSSGRGNAVNSGSKDSKAVAERKKALLGKYSEAEGGTGSGTGAQTNSSQARLLVYDHPGPINSNDVVNEFSATSDEFNKISENREGLSVFLIGKLKDSFEKVSAQNGEFPSEGVLLVKGPNEKEMLVSYVYDKAKGGFSVWPLDQNIKVVRHRRYLDLVNELKQSR